MITVGRSVFKSVLYTMINYYRNLVLLSVEQHIKEVHSSPPLQLGNSALLSATLR